MEKKKILISLLSVLIFTTVLAFLFTQKRIVNDGIVTSQSGEKTNYTDPKTFTEPSDITFRLDQQGHSISQEPNVFTGKLEVPTGTQIPIGASVPKEKKIDPTLVKITLVDTDGTRELTNIEIKDMEYGYEYIAKYTPEKPGKSTISVEVVGTFYKGLLEVSAYDRSLMGEINISEKAFVRNVATLNGDTGIDWINIVAQSPQLKNLGDTPWQLDYPGYLSLPFNSYQTRTKGELKLYALASPEKYNEQPVIPTFYKHTLSLSGYLQNKKDTNPKNNYDIFSFPPANAAMAGISNIRLIHGKGFDGVSYIYGGHFQAFEPAVQPTYVYQGLSRDGKYFVYFEHDIFSSSLRAYMKKTNDCDSQKDFEVCVQESFDALENDKNLDPSTENLNAFVETFEVRE